MDIAFTSFMDFIVWKSLNVNFYLFIIIKYLLEEKLFYYQRRKQSQKWIVNKSKILITHSVYLIVSSLL